METQNGTVGHMCCFWTAFSRRGCVQPRDGDLRDSSVEGIHDKKQGKNNIFLGAASLGQGWEKPWELGLLFPL